MPRAGSVLWGPRRALRKDHVDSSRQASPQSKSKQLRKAAVACFRSESEGISDSTAASSFRVCYAEICTFIFVLEGKGDVGSLHRL